MRNQSLHILQFDLSMFQLESLKGKKTNPGLGGLLIVLAETNKENPLVSVEHAFSDNLCYLPVTNTLILLIFLYLIDNHNLVTLLNQKTSITIF